jgi:hypothetical protein
MPLNFIQEKKRQKYLIYAFLAVFLITAVVLWQGYFNKGKSLLGQNISLPTPPREIKIDFSFLESQTLKDLRPFTEIPDFAGVSGRKVPFLPY